MLAPLVAFSVPRIALADTENPLQIEADTAATWSRDGKNFIQLNGPVSIVADETTLSADRAVIALSPIPGDVDHRQRARIALLGNARAAQPELTRSGEALDITMIVPAKSQIAAQHCVGEDRSDSETFHDAVALAQLETSPQSDTPPVEPTDAPAAGTTVEINSLPPATQPANVDDNGAVDAAPTGEVSAQAAPLRVAPIRGDFGRAQTIQTEDGTIALVIQRTFTLSQQRPNGDLMQLRAERGVIFTNLKSLSADELAGNQTLSDSIVGAYLEGDVVIDYIPSSGGVRAAEQRLEANRVYYDFLTDRAVLTQAVFNTVDLERGMPIIMRAKTIRQLSRTDRVTEFSADHAVLTTSAFARPSLSIGVGKVYVRQTDTKNRRYGTVTTFGALNGTVQAFGVPLFWLPAMGGSMTERGFPLRGIGIGSAKHFGTSIETEWGLFETLGILPPEDLDAKFHLDYYSNRGPAGGLDADYGGGFITDTTRQPWNFEGKFTSYFVSDSGADNLGRERARIGHTNDIRGRVAWEHQHFFPDDWQMQLRANYVSDPTFLEEWFERDYDTGLPAETSAYFKRQHDTEALTFLATIQPNNVVTSSDFVQEQFEIERLPEVGYHRIGDSIGDRLTLFSDNSVSGLKYNNEGLQETIPGVGVKNDQGYRLANPSRDIELTDPGLPSVGTTGTTSATGWRGDFRQEVDYPFPIGEFHVLPYVLGRYTAYSDSPDDSSVDRVFAGAGVRFNTSFYKTYDSVQSELFDIHRVRHVIEPELHLFTSAQTTDRSELYIYDEPIDKINDISGMQLAFRQRWQTKRGAFDRRRSVDFFSFNLEANLFANEPNDDDTPPGNPIFPALGRYDLTNFRGLFFASLPEASIPRDSINADAMWRVSDTFIVLGDAQENIAEGNLATAAVGVAVHRDERLSYYVGMRYIEELNSAIGSVVANYQLTRKYSLTVNQSYDFSSDGTVYSSLGMTRKFDRFFMNVTVFNNSREGDSGFRFNIYPQGIGYGLGTETVGDLFTQ